MRAHDAGQKATAATAAAAGATAEDASAAGATADAAAAASSEALNSAFEDMGMTGSEDYLKNVGSFVAAALDPLGIDVKIDIETPEGRKSCHVSRQTSSASAEASTSQEPEKETKEETKEKETKEETKEKEDAVEKKEETEPARKSVASSDDEEEWTVLNDKKEAEADKKEDNGQGTSLYPKLAENPPAEIPSAPVASHPDPKIQVALP